MGGFLVLSVLGVGLMFGPWAAGGLFTVLVGLFILLAAQSKEEPRQPRRRGGRAQQVLDARSAPDTYIARWRVKYVAHNGEVTKRVVRVTRVRPRAGEFYVWCELRGDVRTFVFTGLKEIVDMETGEFIDLPAWLEVYAASRRRPKKQVKESPPA